MHPNVLKAKGQVLYLKATPSDLQRGPVAAVFPAILWRDPVQSSH